VAPPSGGGYRDEVGVPVKPSISASDPIEEMSYEDIVAKLSHKEPEAVLARVVARLKEIPDPRVRAPISTIALVRSQRRAREKRRTGQVA
jgi:hypothetical protein